MLESLKPVSVNLDHERQLEGSTYLLSFCDSVINYTFLLSNLPKLLKPFSCW